MKTLTVSLILFASVCLKVQAQDSTNTANQGDPSLRQSSKAVQENILKDMVKIPSAQLPESVKKAVESDEFKGSKTYYKHKTKD